MQYTFYSIGTPVMKKDIRDNCSVYITWRSRIRHINTSWTFVPCVIHNPSWKVQPRSDIQRHPNITNGASAVAVAYDPPRRNGWLNWFLRENTNIFFSEEAVFSRKLFLFIYTSTSMHRAVVGLSVFIARRRHVLSIQIDASAYVDRNPASLEILIHSNVIILLS